MQLTLVQRIQHSEPGANEEEGIYVCHITYCITQNLDKETIDT